MWSLLLVARRQFHSVVLTSPLAVVSFAAEQLQGHFYIEKTVRELFVSPRAVLFLVFLVVAN